MLTLYGILATALNVRKCSTLQDAGFCELLLVNCLTLTSKDDGSKTSFMCIFMWNLLHSIGDLSFTVRFILNKRRRKLINPD